MTEMQQTINIVILMVSLNYATIDLNFSELEYLADHLELEECRKLVALAHFNDHLASKSLDKAEHEVPKGVPCLELLLHWNSADGEGKGETHEVLEHRLRQMGKVELADWLGRTVFRQLGHDLEDSLREGLQNLTNETSTTTIFKTSLTLAPVIEVQDPKEWLPIDTISYTLLVVIIFAILLLCCRISCSFCTSKIGDKQKRDSNHYEMLEDISSSSESELEKFDIRNLNKNQETIL